MLRKIKEIISNVVNGIRNLLNKLFTEYPTVTLSYGVSTITIATVALINIVINKTPGVLLTYKLSAGIITIPATIAGFGILTQYVLGLSLVLGTLLYVPNKLFENV